MSAQALAQQSVREEALKRELVVAVMTVLTWEAVKARWLAWASAMAT